MERFLATKAVIAAQLTVFFIFAYSVPQLLNMNLSSSLIPDPALLQYWV